MRTDAGQNLAFGAVAWIATIVIATSWQLATRFGVTTTLAPIDLAVFRYAIPAIGLLPVLLRHGIVPKGQPVWITLLIVVGGGLPFGLLGMAGAQCAPANHMGALLPGSMPVFVAALSAMFLGETFGRTRLLGLAIIVLGVGCIAGAALTGSVGGRNVLIGDALFITAGVFWAVYTVAYRKSGLDPWHGAALICFWSSVLVVPIWVLSPHTLLLSAPIADITLQVAAQGILAGLLGLAAYGAAIRHLGASLAAASGAVVPAFTALGSFFLLSEPLSWLTGLGITSVAIGIWAYSGAPGLPQSWSEQRGVGR